METNYGKTYWWILAVAAILFIPFTGNVHLFDWDEINFAECAREMLVSHDYFQPQINFQPFWEKPPLFIWLQALSMRLLGVNELAARLPNALVGLLTLFTIMRVGDKMSGTAHTGKYWALAFLGSILPHLYFRSGIIDPLFNYFMFLGILYYGYAFAKANRLGTFRYSTYTYAALSGLFIGLGVLTKGPVAYLIPALVIFIEWSIRRFRNFKLLLVHMTILSVTALLTTLLWFGPDLIMNGPWFLKTFITYQIRLFSTPDAGHGGFFGYHFVVLLFGVFPASFLAIRGLIFRKEIRKKNKTLIFNRLMSATFWVVLVLFTIVKSKIVHYSSMAYFPLTYYAGFAVAKTIKNPNEIPLSLKKVILFVGIVIGLIVASVPFLGHHIELLKPFFEQDKFALANLEATVHWPLWQGIAGLELIATVVAWYLICQRNKTKTAYTLLFLGTALFVWLTLSFYIKKIEKYSQNAAIEFFKSKQEEDCYILPVGYKSYAHLFYAKIKPHHNKKAYDTDWLTDGPVDKTTYLVGKITSLNYLKNRPDAKEIYRKNGFIVFVRHPTKPTQ
ncbi:MAG TPA: glycosyltransferase family 39 protein [Saprospiraceae bacterium]|nr:glycosyltransferase family 39 protein [Saprospiraceae bacterium]